MDQNQYRVLILHYFLMGKSTVQVKVKFRDLASGRIRQIWLPATTVVRRPLLAVKKFRSNEEVIAETEAYFEAKDRSFYKSGTEILQRRWIDWKLR